MKPLTLFLAVLMAWLWIAAAVFVRRIFFKHEEAPAWAWIGAATSAVVIGIGGLEFTFAFVPPSWGWLDEDGEFVSLRRSMAVSLAGGLGLLVWYVAGKYEFLSNQIADLKRRLGGEDSRDYDDHWLRSRVDELQRKNAELRSQLSRQYSK